jgi:hypothetical protein
MFPPSISVVIVAGRSSGLSPTTTVLVVRWTVSSLVMVGVPFTPSTPVGLCVS